MNVDWQGAGDIQAIFGTLIDEELNRTVEERDRLSIPISNALIEKFARLGLYKYNLPTVWGGQEVGYAKWGHVLEKLGYLSTDLSFPFLISVRMSFISFLIAVGRKDINDEYLNNLIAGKTGGAFAYTEDADAFSFVSRAVPAPDGETYTVNAVKKIVTGGETRAASVMAGLQALDGQASHVLIHDGARPLVSDAVIQGVIDALQGGAQAAAPALPAPNTPMAKPWLSLSNHLAT